MTIFGPLTHKRNVQDPRYLSLATANSSFMSRSWQTSLRAPVARLNVKTKINCCKFQGCRRRRRPILCILHYCKMTLIASFMMHINIRFVHAMQGRRRQRRQLPNSLFTSLSVHCRSRANQSGSSSH
jgi:hypothetical protein